MKKNILLLTTLNLLTGISQAEDGGIALTERANKTPIDLTERWTKTPIDIDLTEKVNKDPIEITNRVSKGHMVIRRRYRPERIRRNYDNDLRQIPSTSYERSMNTSLENLWNDLDSYTPNITLVREDLDALINGTQGGGYGDIPLHYAAFYAALEPKTGNKAVLELLVERGSNLNAKNLDNETPLQTYLNSCKTGHTKANPEIVALLTPKE